MENHSTQVEVMCGDKSKAPVTDNYLSPDPNDFGHSTCWRPILGGKPANYCKTGFRGVEV